MGKTNGNGTAAWVRFAVPALAAVVAATLWMGSNKTDVAVLKVKLQGHKEATVKSVEEINHTMGKMQAELVRQGLLLGRIAGKLDVDTR